MLRGVWPALREKGGRSLVFLVAIATVSIGLLFGAGLFYGQHAHISIMEYWRWWVVHMWVEGNSRCSRPRSSPRCSSRWAWYARRWRRRPSCWRHYLPWRRRLGTFHHLYFSGTTMIGDCAWAPLSPRSKSPRWRWSAWKHTTDVKAEHLHVEERYAGRSPSSLGSVWNLVGAGLFGFS